MVESLEAFVAQLNENGIVTGADLSTFRARHAPADAAQLSRLLVEHAWLTAYQAQIIDAGRARELTLGNYLVLDKLGQGGMGIVYKARHRRMDRIVALKVLSPTVVQSAELLVRFQREVQVAARLQHPNIVLAFDADEAHGTHFLVMQYVAGCDLSLLVKQRGPLSVAQAVDCVRQAAHGLEYAHGHGVIHRDVKPANLLLDEAGTVRILDLGLARIEGQTGAGAELTTTGAVMGSVDYMAPEQALDTRTADARSDVYSLGVTLWYLLVGRPVYGGESLMARLVAHREAPVPSLKGTRGDVPAALDALFRKMIAKRSEDRCQSMSEVLAALPVGRTSAADRDGHLAQVGWSGDVREASLGEMTKFPDANPDDTTIVPSAPPSEATTRFRAADVPRSGPGPAPRDWWTRRHLPWVAVMIAGACLAVGLARNTPGRRAASGGIGSATPGVHQPSPSPSRTPVDVKPETKPPVVAMTEASVPKSDATSLKPEIVKPPVPPAEPPRPAPQPAIAPFAADQARAFQKSWAESLGVPVEHANSFGMKFVLIPPGEFRMGSDPAELEEALRDVGNDPYRSELIRSEAPQHAVVLTRPFYLGVHEVTQRDYERVAGDTPAHFRAAGPGRSAVGGDQTDDHPIESVSWNDAAEFCAALSAKERLQPFYQRSGETVTLLDGDGYRLPTEAEWEFAYRAGTPTRYSTGNAEADLLAAAWFGSNADSRTHAVGGRQANPFGLHDMHGNVSEWVQDWWAPAYSAGPDGKPVRDPTGPSEPGSRRVVRGGDWSSTSASCRTAHREAIGPTDRFKGTGFRVVLTVDAVKAGLDKDGTRSAERE